MTDLVIAAQVIDRHEAVILRAMLEAADIPAFLPDFEAFGAMPYLTHMAGGYRVLVRKEQSEDAKRIIEDARATATLEERDVD